MVKTLPNSLRITIPVLYNIISDLFLCFDFVFLLAACAINGQLSRVMRHQPKTYIPRDDHCHVAPPGALGPPF